MPRHELDLPLHRTLIANYKRLYAHARLSGWPAVCEHLEDMRKLQLPATKIYTEFLAVLKTFMPKFTKRQWQAEIDRVDNLRLDRGVAKHTVAYPSLAARLNSGEARYAFNHLAQRFYERHGEPKFKLKIISGIVLGNGVLETNGKRGWAKKIYRRYIGVCISRDATTQHICLRFDVP